MTATDSGVLLARWFAGRCSKSGIVPSTALPRTCSPRAPRRHVTLRRRSRRVSPTSHVPAQTAPAAVHCSLHLGSSHVRSALYLPCSPQLHPPPPTNPLRFTASTSALPTLSLSPSLLPSLSSHHALSPPLSLPFTPLSPPPP
eukprot:3931960-Rhodomonas_salina.2